jgi:hypothetical protein
MAETTKSASGRVEQATVPSVPWTTSMPVTPACFELGGELGGQLFRGQRDELWPPANGLREGFVDVAPGGQRGDRVALGKLLDDGEGALADGAGGTENGEFFHDFAGDRADIGHRGLLVEIFQGKNNGRSSSGLLPSSLGIEIQPDQVARIRYVSGYQTSAPRGGPQSYSPRLSPSSRPSSSSSSVIRLTGCTVC